MVWVTSCEEKEEKRWSSSGNLPGEGGLEGFLPWNPRSLFPYLSYLSANTYHCSGLTSSFPSYRKPPQIPQVLSGPPSARIPWTRVKAPSSTCALFCMHIILTIKRKTNRQKSAVLPWYHGLVISMSKSPKGREQPKSRDYCFIPVELTQA